MAETLSKHYSEGRLDETEFNERLQRAVSAKTRGDLAGLLVDLPPIVTPLPQEMVNRHRRSRFGLLLIASLLFAMAVSSAMWTWHFPWLLAAVVFFVVWRMSHRGWHRHHWERGRYGEPPVSPGQGMHPEHYHGRGPGDWV